MDAIYIDPLDPKECDCVGCGRKFEHWCVFTRYDEQRSELLCWYECANCTCMHLVLIDAVTGKVLKS